MEQLLLAMDRLGSRPLQQQQQQQQGWLASLFGGRGGSSGGGGGGAGGGDLLSSGALQQGGASGSQVRRLLQQWRQQELAADADTADFSSEPYDSIPRQVELQWRTYAKLYPEDAAACARAAALLQRSGPGAAAAAAAAAGRGSAGGWLPSAVELQRTLQTITAASPAGSASGGGGAASAASAASPAAAASSPAREWVARHARQQPAVPFGRDLADPHFLRLLVSLESWYGAHAERLAPLRRGRRARLLALRGVPLPPAWQLGPGRGGKGRGAGEGGGRGGAGGGGGWPGAGLLRWCAGAVGLRTRPRVWEVTVAEREEQEEQERPLKAVAAQQQPGGLLGAPVAAARSGAGTRPRGLQAAQGAARAGQFALRRVTLVPADWL
ncbi:hypothetical protein HXX76_006764 [Chlamydomonas incerta]|uniref:Uncharacterized protein n=1 Tax=Chlamydomonas incerta TaxID=51695 RepID=A0A835TDX9_CHLIN|nr:hypothetical protein HXX76_006764 [Chlamydomonas incerta]|eukprot:KAG2436461.1 hypothetical protein HXX76_006764 [Chlamydomonas incerta]